MLSLIKLLFKTAIFAAIVLVLGNVIRWNGKTLSDQVKTQVSHAERSEPVEKVKGWAKGLTSDAKKGAKPVIDRVSVTAAAVEKNMDGKRERRSEDGISPVSAAVGEAEEIPSSERQKLKALIRDLKTPTN